MEGDYERGDYLKGNPGVFVHWLARCIEPQTLTVVPSDRELAIRAPRIVGKNKIEVDVELLDKDFNETWSNALTFEVKQIDADVDIFWVESCCFDPYVEYAKLIKELREEPGLSEPEEWPKDCNAPLVAFSEALWTEIHRYWPKPTKGLPKRPKERGRKSKGALRLEDRPNVDTMREKARKYKKKIESGTPKEIAADLVGKSRRTLDRWVERLL